MKKEAMQQQLSTIIGVLNTVTVCGKQNLASLSGCISALEQILSFVSQPEPTKKDGEK